MRFYKDGELQDEEIEKTLHEAANMYANGEIVETYDTLLDIIDALSAWFGN